MRHLWPELLVLGLFLLGDLFFTGMESAAAAFGAGVLAFLVLLLSGSRRPGLLVEGAFFGAVTALGTLTSFPGGSLILMEICMGAVLLVSVPLKWKLVGRMSMGMIPEAQATRFAVVMGGVFTVHGILYTAAALAGRGGAFTGILLFAVLYLAALGFTARRMRREGNLVKPLLVSSGEDRHSLMLEGRELGTMVITAGKVAGIRVVELFTHGDEFLRNLETALKNRGCGAVEIGQWPGDDIDLEIRGYLRNEKGWRKRP